MKTIIITIAVIIITGCSGSIEYADESRHQKTLKKAEQYNAKLPTMISESIENHRDSVIIIFRDRKHGGRVMYYDGRMVVLPGPKGE